jgi:hypothetical protein
VTDQDNLLSREQQAEAIKILRGALHSQKTREALRRQSYEFLRRTGHFQPELQAR